jgi:predicted HAD superfamily Cof-like phosphohydrolase
MRKYLYCIQYGVIDKALKYPEVAHVWLDEHPNDDVIKEIIDAREKPFNTSISSFYYHLVHDNTKLVPFVNEVETFNRTFGKPNNYIPNIPKREEWEFVYNFVLEELEEYKEACENGDIVGILDALCDITYVSLGNGAMLHGLKHKIVDAYSEIQASNMSKSCKTEEEAIQTVELRSQEQGEPCHYEEKDDYYVVYRTRDRKVMKSINYFKPDLTQFFSVMEMEDCMNNNKPSTII